MLFRPPTPVSSALLVAMKIQPIVPSEYAKGYDTYANFNSAYTKLQQGKTSEFQLKDGLMYKRTQLCILEDGDRLQWIRCVLCNTSKPSNRKLGLYLPLTVPSRSWESISMDFLGGLPKTKSGNDYLFVVVDRFKSRFLGHFWRLLWGMIDTRLKRSTAFHPQTDGQTKVVIYPKDIRVQKFLKQVRKIHTEVEAQLKRSQQQYKAHHDKHRVPCNFKEGDLVWLHLGKERLTDEGKKLKPIRYGPFKIIKQIGDNAFQLELPPYMHMYSVINAENLKLFEPSLLDNDPEENTRLPSVDDLRIE
ncbi:unnamed protein product [Prunus armeniaca]